MSAFSHQDLEKECVCGPGVVKRYLSKISGPLLDRIDLHVEVTPVSNDELTTYQAGTLKCGIHSGIRLGGFPFVAHMETEITPKELS